MKIGTTFSCKLDDAEVRAPVLNIRLVFRSLACDGMRDFSSGIATKMGQNQPKRDDPRPCRRAPRVARFARKTAKLQAYRRR